MEWQADTLAAALLMPQKVFTLFAKAVFYKYGVFNGYIMVDHCTDKVQARDIIKEIAERFHVSYRAAQIRMLHLGLIRDPYVY
jgi:Zn-dependent peptidase ImmA (M78 family)